MASINPQPSGSNQESDERNQVVLPGQGPQRASITRDRSEKSTQGKYSERGKKTDVKKIGLHERLQSFPNEHSCIRVGKLFFNACHELLSTKKSILQNHCKSKKHAQGKEKLVKWKKRDATITEALKADNASCRLQTSTLPLEVRAFRVQVVEDFLKGGVPL